MNLLGMMRKVVSTVRNKGALGLMRVSFNRVRVAILQQAPARRRVRAEALAFDRRYGTDTASSQAIDEALPNVEHAVRYQPSGRDMFDQILRLLDVDCARFTFVDIGSGKGRVLLFASDHPFARIVGVEFSPRLHAIAENNVRIYRGELQRCFAITPLFGDATSVTLPPGPLFIYLYNPFSEPIMSGFVANLRRALDAAPREVWVAYLNPVERAAFDNASWLTLVRDMGEWVAYHADA
jgi:SAM-dependent methyltransferase